MVVNGMELCLGGALGGVERLVPTTTLSGAGKNRGTRHRRQARAARE
jgi:hypothetical protein